ELTAVRGARVTGQVISDNEQVPLTPNEVRGLQIFVRPLDGWNLQSVESFPVNDDGTFTSMALPAGRFLLTIIGSLEYVSRVQVGDIDARDRGFEIPGPGADVAGVTVSLMRPPVHLSGTVLGANSAPRPDAYIVYFPSDVASRNPWTVRRTRPNQLGNWRINVSPGKYFVAAVEGGLPDDWRDAAYLSKLASRALRVEVGKTDIV